MNTTLKLPQLTYLLEEFPHEHDLISRLDTFINGRNYSLELDSKEVIEILQPTDMTKFIMILKSLEQTKLVDFAVQVNGSDGEKLQQFASIMDIPQMMFDPTTGKDFTVLLTDVVGVYTFHSPHNLDNKIKIK